MKATFPPALKKYLPYVPIVVILGFVFTFLPKLLFPSYKCSIDSPPTHYLASNGFFIDNQVIVIGPGLEVEGAVPKELVLVENCEPRNKTKSTVPEGERESYVMRLYEVQDDTPIGEIIAQIRSGNVLADPNYLVSLTDASTGSCGAPFSGGGSPFSGGGSPYGGPGILKKDPRMDETNFEQFMQEQFTSQWAFDTQGIDLQSSLGVTGRGVRVAVFDTVPFPKTHPFLRRIGIAFPSPLWLTNIDAYGSDISSTHGLFVAGLIHRVAPKSKIQLIRVLNNDGCGDLWKITKALYNYTNWMSAWRGDLNKVVINMSLGVHIPDEMVWNELVQQELAQQDEESALPTGWSELLNYKSDEVDDSVKAEIFKWTIEEAVKKGAVIVAAAGNDSPIIDEDGNEEIAPTQYPAKYENVIGVAATNTNGKRSCYSNNGNVAAPGGDGAPGRDEDDTSIACLPRASTWNKSDPDLDPDPDSGLEFEPCTGNMSECLYGLISLSQTDEGIPRYVYWVGTSFSAPLVSGLAALVYEEVESDPNLVRCIIENGATPVFLSGTTDEQDESLGAGIIKVNESLSLNIDNIECPPR